MVKSVLKLSLLMGFVGLRIFVNLLSLPEIGKLGWNSTTWIHQMAMQQGQFFPVSSGNWGRAFKIIIMI